MNRVLVVEDTEEVRELLRTILVLKDFVVLEAANGRAALELVKQNRPDVIILDLMLPDIYGLDICEKLKEDPETLEIPILILTAKTEVLDRVKGLEAGADDYLAKPFDTLELIARVRALLRRSGYKTDEKRAPITLGGFEIDPGSYTLSIQGAPVTNLTVKEFDILYILIKYSPNPVSRENIFQVVWGKSQRSYSRAIDLHIVNIRKKLGPQHSNRIITIPEKGYLFSSK